MNTSNSLLKQPPMHLNLIVTFFCFASMLVGQCHIACAQHQSDTSDYDQRVSRILDMISSGPFAQSDPFIELSKSFLETHARYHEALAQDRMARLDQAAANYRLSYEQVSSSERVESSDGTTAVNLETVELLLRECLLELQRLDWESATEETAPNLQLAEQQALFADLKLRKKESAYEGLRKELDIAQESYSGALKRREAGSISAAEFEQSALRWQNIQSRIEQAELEIRAVREELKLQRDSDVVSQAEGQNRIQNKRKVLRQQIERLKDQRIRARKSELLLDEIARQRKYIAELSEQATRSELRASETRTLLKYVDDSLRKDKTQENSPERK